MTAYPLLAKRMVSPPWLVNDGQTRYETPPLLIKQFSQDFERLKQELDSGEVDNEQTTSKSSGDNESNSINDSYKMAAQVAVGAAIIVALAILLALIWNSLKKRLPNSNNSGMSSSTTRRRHSSDSLNTLVENRLRDRPPPYSPDQDKPPSYEESFHDSSIRQQSPVARSRDRRRHQRGGSGGVRVHESNRGPTPTTRQESLSSSRHQSSALPSLPSYSSAIRVVSYDNQAFNNDDEQHNSTTVAIPSISRAVHQSEMTQVSIELENEDMLHSHL